VEFKSRGNSGDSNGLAKILGRFLWLEQLQSDALTILLAIIASAIIGRAGQKIIGADPAEIERQGLDINEPWRRRLHGFG